MRSQAGPTDGDRAQRSGRGKELEADTSGQEGCCAGTLRFLQDLSRGAEFDLVRLPTSHPHPGMPQFPDLLFLKPVARELQGSTIFGHDSYDLIRRPGGDLRFNVERHLYL